MSLFTNLYYDLYKKNEYLLKINIAFDWNKIEQLIKSYKISNKNIGRRGYGSLYLIKCLFLQNWYHYTDRQLIENITQRADFQVFLDSDFYEKKPDISTIRKFRNFVIKNKLDEVMFSEINNQLNELGIIKDINDLGIVDSTVVSSYSRPRSKEIKFIAIDREEDQQPTEYIVEKTYSKDRDAQWIKKNGYYYGYKLFLAVNENGFILRRMLAPANKGESPYFIAMTEGLPVVEIQADKGYTSKENSNFLKANNFIDGIMHKKPYKKEMPKDKKLRNQEISSTRFVVERTNGQLKRVFGLFRFNFIGLTKSLYQATMVSMCSNILLSLKHIKL